MTKISIKIYQNNIKKSIKQHIDYQETRKIVESSSIYRKNYKNLSENCYKIPKFARKISNR